MVGEISGGIIIRKCIFEVALTVIQPILILTTKEFQVLKRQYASLCVLKYDNWCWLEQFTQTNTQTTSKKHRTHVVDGRLSLYHICLSTLQPESNWPLCYCSMTQALPVTCWVVYKVDPFGPLPCHKRHDPWLGPCSTVIAITEKLRKMVLRNMKPFDI